MRIKHLKYLILLLLSSCASVQNVTREEGHMAALYNPSEYSLNSDYRFYHISDALTSLYIRLYPTELLFHQANEDGEYRSLVQIDYTIFELGEYNQIVDTINSSSIVIKLLRDDQQKNAFFSTKVISLDAGKNYLVRLESKDMNRGSMGLKYLYVLKKNVYSSQNFCAVSPRSGYPKFFQYFMPGEVFKITYRNWGLDSVYLDIINVRSDFPRPPVGVSSSDDYRYVVDTTMKVPYSDSMLFTLPEKGLYYFRLDTLQEEGVALLNFGKDYPQIKTAEDMLEPLFYLASGDEYLYLKSKENTKLAVDDFWLQRANSPDRSRELIRVYYNRVLYSNVYFTSHLEGWKTDRGLVYILFGPPDRMRDTGEEQHWYYISKKLGKIIDFTFERKPGLYSNQELVWKKSPQAMSFYSAAMNSWRSGKVYSLSN